MEELLKQNPQLMEMIMAQMGGGDSEPWLAKANDSSVDQWVNKANEENMELACFGAGCYWGTEKYFAKDFEKKFPGSILGTSVGFMNPDANAPPNPSYEEVCDGTSGYIEVAYILFDNSKASFE